jgi:hypothetical protein
MNITTNIEKITPKIASELLLNNHSAQRNVSLAHVTNLSNQMKSGLWKTNGESIILDGKSNILDGQHRLRAVVMSGVTIDFLIVRGVNPECFTTIDGGMKRSCGQIFTIAGVSDGNNFAACASGVMNYRRAVNVIIREKGGGMIKGGSLSTNIRPSPQEVMYEYSAHKIEYDHAVKIARKVRHMITISASGTIAALALIDGNESIEWVTSFWESVATGENLTSQSPAYHLRERHIANKGARHKFSVNHSILLCAKAWNLYASEKSCKLLRISDERAFPVL